MKKAILIVFLSLIGILQVLAQTNPNHVWVNGYYRSNGTYVEGYYRTAPNKTNVDNFSTKGNTNPYTGEAGWINPDNKANPWKEDKVLQTFHRVQPYTSTKNNNSGIVNRSSSSPTNATSNTQTNWTSNGKSFWYSKGDQVNVRFLSNTNSKIAFILNRGDKVDVVSKSDSKDYIKGYGEDYWYCRLTIK